MNHYESRVCRSLFHLQDVFMRHFILRPKESGAKKLKRVEPRKGYLHIVSFSIIQISAHFSLAMDKNYEGHTFLFLDGLILVTMFSMPWAQWFKTYDMHFRPDV